jgi:hypothetical protein
MTPLQTLEHVVNNYNGADPSHRDTLLAALSEGLAEFKQGQRPTLTIEGAARIRLDKFHALAKGKKQPQRVGVIGRLPVVGTGLIGVAAHLGPNSCTAHKAPSSVWDRLSTDLDNNVF